MNEIVCPEKNLSEWKSLVEAVGEEAAFLAFFRNKNSIPSEEQAKSLLGIKAEAPAKVLSPSETLSQSKRIHVTMPEGATMLRITTSDGKKATETLKNLNKGDNPFHGVDNISKIEAGHIGVSGANKGKFMPVTGDVTIKPVVEAVKSAAEPQKGTPISEEELQSIVDSIIPKSNANYLSIVNEPDVEWSGISKNFGDWKGTGSQIGIIELNRANIFSPDMARDVLFEELMHSVWGAPEIAAEVKLFEEAVDAEMTDRMKRLGYTPEQVTEEAAVKLVNDIRKKLEGQGWFRRLLTKLMILIKRIFGVTLSPEEAASAILRKAVKFGGRGFMQRPARAANEDMAAKAGKYNPPEIPTEPPADDGVEVQIGGQRIIVPGTERLTPEEIAAGQKRALAVFQGLKLPGQPSEKNVFSVEPDGFNYDAEGRRLIESLASAIKQQNLKGADAAIVPMLVRAINYNLDAWEQVFSPEIADELRGISAGESSLAGQRLRMMQGKNADVVEEIARNMSFYLKRVYAEMFGGDAVQSFTKRVLEEFGKSFTDDELAAIAASKPEQEKLINKIIAENQVDQGGRVYRKVQQLLKPKSARKLSRLESDAKVNEAAQKIIEDAAKQGITPPEKKGKPLSPIQKLLLMVEPKNMEKLNKLIGQAVKDAEFNAGVRAALNEAPDRDAREDLEARFAAGEEPTPEQIEKGLDLPEFEHWKVIRENLTSYTPVTRKLAGQVVPKVTELAKELLSTPAYRQPGMKERFMTRLTDSLGVSEEQARTIWNALDEMYGERATQARRKAMATAVKSMTPREQEVMPKRDNKLWRKLEAFFNAGGDNVGGLLNVIAQLRGFDVPSPQEVERMKLLAQQIQRLKMASPGVQKSILEDPNLSDEQKSDRLHTVNSEAEAANSFEIGHLMQQMGVYWSRMVRPIVFPGWRPEQIAKWWNHRSNLVDAAMDYATHDVLEKFGFVGRLITHVFAGQMLWFSPTRMLGRISLELSKTDNKSVDEMWKTSYQAISDEWKATLASIKPAALAFGAGIRGRRVLDKPDQDRLLNSLNTMDRITTLASEKAAKGDYVQATLLHIFALPKYVGWFLQAVDGAQKAAIEYPELLHNIAVALRAQGKTSAEIGQMSEHIVRMMNYELMEADAEVKRMYEAEGKPTDGLLNGLKFQEIAAQVVRRRIYNFMKLQGLPADDFESANTLLKRANAWQERVEHGPGALATMTMGMVRRVAGTVGLPVPSMVLANAIGTGMNYALFGTPFYKLADLRIPGLSKTKHSPFFATELDRHQRAWNALIGTLIGSLIVYLVLHRDDKGQQAITVRKWPKNKDESMKWAAQGRKAMTMEFNHGDGSFTPVSLIVGPLTPVAPYAFAAQAIDDIFQKRAAQEKSNKEKAAKLGVPAQPLPPIGQAELMAVAANAFLGTLMSNRTVSGMFAAGTEYGTPNLKKIIASNVSSLIPLVPGYQELTRMEGITLDPKLATVADFIIPTGGSPAREMNMLGEPVMTPDDVQRVVQVMTGGTYPFAVSPGDVQEEGPSESNAAYTALFASGLRVPATNPTRGYDINGTYRPMTGQELERFTQLRGDYLRQNLSQQGAQATHQTAQQALHEATAQALSDLGVSTQRPTSQKAAPAPAAKAVRGVKRGLARSPRSLRVSSRSGFRRHSFRGIRPRSPRAHIRAAHPRSLRVRTPRTRARRLRV